jgi:hypothetical protein
VVAGRTQWDDALRVAAALDAPADVLDLGTLDVGPPPPPGTAYGGAHWPPQGYRAVADLVRLLRRRLPSTSALVLGQDAGRLQQVAAAEARRAGVPVAVVPDGALFEGSPELRPRLRAQEALLRRLRVTSGRPGTFGSTSPDLWCAWGPGWTPMLRRFSPEGRVVVTGSPRAADLVGLPDAAEVPGVVLLCSQPTWVHPFPASPTAGPRWYRWLDSVVADAPPGRVAVRLHPREQDIAAELGLGPAVLAACTHGSTLAEDLAGVAAVVAPFSTVLLEAAAAGRRVVSVVPEAGCLPVREASPSMADERLTVLLADDVPTFAALQGALAAAPDPMPWGRDYAEVGPDNAARCAAAVEALAS